MQPSLLLARISRRTQCLQRSSFQRPRYFSSAIASCHDGPSTSSSDGFPAPDGPPAQLLDNNTEPPSHLEPPLIEHPPSDNGESGNTVRYLVPRPEVQWNRRTGKRIDEKRQGQGKGSIAGVPVKFIRGDEPYERSSPGRGEYWVPKTYDSEDFLSHETQLVGQWKLEGTNAAETFGFTRPWQRYGGEYGCRDFTIRSLQR